MHETSKLELFKILIGENGTAVSSFLSILWELIAHPSRCRFYAHGVHLHPFICLDLDSPSTNPN